MLADYLLDDSKSQSRDAFAAALTLGVVSVPYVLKLVGSYTAAVVGYRDDSLCAAVTQRNADPFVLACVADGVVQQIVYRPLQPRDIAPDMDAFRDTALKDIAVL